MNQPKLTETTTERLKSGTAMPSFAGVGVANQQLLSFGNGAAPARDPLRPKKVAIIGTAPSSRLLAPYKDPEWTIWGSSPGNHGEAGNPNTPMALPRFDAWFEVHNNFLWDEYISYGGPYVEWLNKQKCPVLAADVSMFKNAKPFPWQELVAKYGPYFFTSTFAWMMAYAIEAGAEVIGLYGVDMASKNEYILQRPGGHYFITKARERKIQIVVPDESDLLQPPPLYGISASTPMGRKMAARRIELQGRINQGNMQLGQLQQQIAYFNGASEDMEYIENIWSGVQAELMALQAEIVALRAENIALRATQNGQNSKAGGLSAPAN